MYQVAEAMLSLMPSLVDIVQVDAYFQQHSLLLVLFLCTAAGV
jgi:hypothetical protein